MRKGQAVRKASIERERQRREREAAAARQRRYAEIVNRAWARIES